jgi:ribonuclease BN (tRNA processing enzyme)
MMKLRVLGAHGGDMPGCHMSAFLLDEQMLLDAGTIGQVLDLKEQGRIRDVMLTHSHLDHCNALPFFAVNIFSADAPAVVIHGLKPTLDAVSAHILNNQVWPDFTKIKKLNGEPVFSLNVLAENEQHRVGSFDVRPVRVNHPVPTCGYVITRDSRSFVYTGDTGITDAIWDAAIEAPNLRTILTEVSFPNKMQKLAEMSGHLTPNDLKKELEKLRRKLEIPVLIYHMKPEYDAEIRKELKELKLPGLEVLKAGKTYDL